MRGRRRAEHVRDARFSRERSEFHDFISILSIQNFSYVFVHFWKHPKCIAFELWTTIGPLDPDVFSNHSIQSG